MLFEYISSRRLRKEKKKGFRERKHKYLGENKFNEENVFIERLLVLLFPILFPFIRLLVFRGV